MNQTNENKDNKIILQILLINNKDKSHYKSLIAVSSLQYYREHQREIKEKGIQKICEKEQMTLQELINKGYTTIKITLNKRRKG